MSVDTKSNRGDTYDLHSKFDIQQHEAHYVNYLEVIVRPMEL